MPERAMRVSAATKRLQKRSQSSENCGSTLSRAARRASACQDPKKTALMSLHETHWEFCLCYRDGEFSHWEWRHHHDGGIETSVTGFPTLSTCVHDAMKHGYAGGGKIMPGIVRSSGNR